MIKILPSGTITEFSFGLNSWRKKTVRGRLGEGAREHQFVTPTAILKAVWRDNGIEAVVLASSAVRIRQISITFKFHSPRPAGETAIWTDKSSVNEPGGMLTVRKHRAGAGALWLSESIEAEGILFRQSPPVEYPILFNCHPGTKTLTVSWSIERNLSEGEKLVLPTIRMSRGEKGRLIGSWRREWRTVSTHTPSVDRRVAWRESGEADSPAALKELIAPIREARLPVDWFALGPGYASATGDWLDPADSFRDRMGNASRSISEQNMIPGLRFAPFLVSKKSSIAAERKDWMVRNSSGKPVSVKAYNRDGDTAWILDVSNAEVRKHVKRMMTVMRDQWGFRAFILERLDDIAIPGIRNDEKLGPGALYHLAGELIREALGNRVYIAAEGIPLQLSSSAWDARFVSPEPQQGRGRRADKSRLASASLLLHRSAWAEGSWSNASCPLSVSMFRPDQSTATCTLLNAAAISTGLTLFSGDPRKADDDTFEAIRHYLQLFEESRSGLLRMSENRDGGQKEPLIVRNETGRIGLFNFSHRRKEVRLDRDNLKSALGMGTSLSAGDGAVFNSPEIHVALPPRGNRLFKG